MMMAQSAFSNCDTDFSNLEKFYEASKNEDFNSYISLMDTDYIYDYLADKENYELYVKSAWEVYETKSYSVKLLKCNEIPTGSIVFSNVKSELVVEGEDVELDRDYAAIFENGRIQFVMDFETFMMHQNSAYMLQYYNYSKELVNKELEQAESLAAYLKNYEPVKKGFSWIWYVLLIMVIGLLYFSKDRLKKVKNIKKPKIDVSKIKDKFEKTKNISIQKISEGTDKFKEVATPHYNNLKNKAKEVYDNREEHIASAKSFAKKTSETIEKHSKKAIKTAKEKIDGLKK